MSLTPDFEAVRADVSDGFKKWRIWTRVGWRDVKRRYRRTVLGPLWNTLSLALLAGAMTYIWAPMMNADIRTFLPWVLSGVVCWAFLNTLITEAGTLFTGAESLLKQLRFPLSALALTAIWRDIIVFFHNLLVVVLVGVLLNVPFTPQTLLFFPGLVLIALNAFWFMPLLALLSARFRDVPPLMASLLTVFYFVTPIFWRTEQLQGRTFLYDVNYLHHLISMVRAPLMGEAPSALSYVVVISSIAVGYAVTYVLFALFRRRVTYWL